LSIAGRAMHARGQGFGCEGFAFWFCAFSFVEGAGGDHRGWTLCEAFAGCPCALFGTLVGGFGTMVKAECAVVLLGVVWLHMRWMSLP
jgi:hypothetical protein